MGLNAIFVLLGLLAAVGLGKAVRDFDRKMVAAGQRRKRESEARMTPPAPPQ